MITCNKFGPRPLPALDLVGLSYLAQRAQRHWDVLIKCTYPDVLHAYTDYSLGSNLVIRFESRSKLQHFSKLSEGAVIKTCTSWNTV